MKDGAYEKLKHQVWDILEEYQHTIGVWHHFCGAAALSAFLGLKRGLNMEICKCAGLLHDVWLFCNLPLDRDMHKNHGYIGSELARDILNQNGGYSDEEIEIICTMIYHHNDKGIVHDEYSEVLKDADSLEHYLNNSGYDQKYNYHGRDKKILDEFTIG